MPMTLLRDRREGAVAFSGFQRPGHVGLEHCTVQRPPTALWGILETATDCIILYAWHNYTAGFCLLWCQSVSKHMPLPRFAYVKCRGCPLITIGICELCVHGLSHCSPEAHSWEKGDGSSPEKMVNNGCFCPGRKRGKWQTWMGWGQIRWKMVIKFAFQFLKH